MQNLHFGLFEFVGFVSIDLDTKKWLLGMMEARIKRWVYDWKRLEILEMNIQEDHIHLVISIPPKFAVSEIVGFLKGKCAIKIFDKHLKDKKRYWGRHFWAKGYCVSTVGLNEEEIRKYVRWQLEKDKRIEQLKLWQ